VIKIPKMTMRERAFDYPYDAPKGAYLLQNGYVQTLEPDYDFSQRIAVLSVGSNRAPAQLYRKFGDKAEVPVTPVQVQDCDIIHVANLANYGAVPCSAFPSLGTSIVLNIAWLTAEQLVVMHATESLGEAYEWIEWDPEVITVLSHQKPEKLFGYSALAGAFNLSGQGPFSLSRIPAENRQFVSATQIDMQNQIFIYFAPNKDLDSWVETVQNDAKLRGKIRQLLAQSALEAKNPPWRKSPDLSGG